MKSKNLMTFIGCIVFLFSINMSAQLTMPQGSQRASVSQKVGITDITITYSRPSVKNREIWGNLVPYGMNNLGFGTAKESPWRAGANENTTIEFTDDVKIEGNDIKAGIYGLHMNVKENGSVTIILSSDSTSWGSYFYDPAKDVLQVDVASTEIPHKELLTYEFIAVDATSTTAALQWEKKQIPFKIEVAVTDIVINNLRKELQTSKGFTHQTWAQGAQYILNNGGDLNEALKWIDNAISGVFIGNKTAGNLGIKAAILEKMGKKSEAIAIIDEAKEMANMNQLNALAYQVLGMGDKVKALALFKENVKRNPKVANMYDSLGDGYKAMGDTKNAIKNYKKVLTLNPQAAVRAASVKNLKSLGVDVE